VSIIDLVLPSKSSRERLSFSTGNERNDSLSSPNEDLREQWPTILVIQYTGMDIVDDICSLVKLVMLRTFFE
jgi:hypothetical protein